MNLKRAKLLLAAFVAALVLFYLFLNVPLPSPTSPSAQTPPVGHDSDAPLPGRRVAVTSLAHENPTVASPGHAAPGKTSDVTEHEKATTPSAPPARRAQLTPRTVPEPQERPLDAPARRAPAPPGGVAGTKRRRALDDDVSALEKLLATEEAVPVLSKEPSQNDQPDADLVAELERLFASTTTGKRVTGSKWGAARVDSDPGSVAASLPPQRAPRTVEEWQTRRRHYRALAREVDTDKATAVFRLEQHDPETFRAVMTQYRMDILLEIPAQGTYSIVPHGGDYWERTEFRKGENDLRIRYGLSVRDLSLPWLRKLRETHVATKLVSTESVDVALLVPTRETEILLGNIVAGCRSLGHSLEEVSACYGRFVERVLSGKRLFDYEVTRLILRDGTLVEAGRT